MSGNARQKSRTPKKSIRREEIEPRTFRSPHSPTGLREKWTYWYRTDTGEQICGGRSRYWPEGLHCSLGHDKLFDNGRCRNHGGARQRRTPKTGIYARRAQIGNLMVAAEKRAENEHKMLNLLPAIGLFDERLNELTERAAEGDCPEWRKELRGEWRKFRRAHQMGDTETADSAMRRLDELIADGYEEDQLWKEILTVAERRSTRAEKANELRIKGQNVVAKAELMVAIMKVVAVVQNELGTTPDGYRTFERIFRRVDSEIVEDSRREVVEVPKDSPALLPRVQGEGGGVRSGSPGDAPMGNAEGDHRGGVPGEDGDL